MSSTRVIDLTKSCVGCRTPMKCARAGQCPRQHGREPRGPDECDCLNRCGDDPWLASGKAQPCAKKIAEDQAARQAAELAQRQAANAAQARQLLNALGYVDCGDGGGVVAALTELQQRRQA